VSERVTANRQVARLLAWGAALMFKAASTVSAVLFALTSPSVLDELDLTESQLGTLSAVYLATYATGQLVMGTLLGRYPLRLIVAGTALLAAAGSILFAASPSMPFALAGRVLLGLGLSANFVALMHVISRDYPERFSFMSAISQSIPKIAGMAIAILASFTVFLTVFRMPHIILGAVFVLIAVTGYLFIGEKSVESPTVASKRETVPFRTVLETCFKSGPFWLALIYFAAMNGTVIAYSGLWSMRFQVDDFGASIERAALMNALLAVGAGAGSVLAGLWAQRRGDYVLPIRVYGLIGVILFMVMFLFVLSKPLALVANFLIGFALSGSILGFSVIQKRLPEYAHSAATAITATAALIVGGVLQPYIGDLMAAPVHAHALLSSYIVGHPVFGMEVAIDPDFATYQKGLAPLLAFVIIGFLASLWFRSARETPKPAMAPTGKRPTASPCA